jgi:hypothetical protein
MFHQVPSPTSLSIIYSWNPMKRDLVWDLFWKRTYKGRMYGTPLVYTEKEYARLCVSRTWLQGKTKRIALPTSSELTLRSRGRSYSSNITLRKESAESGTVRFSVSIILRPGSFGKDTKEWEPPPPSFKRIPTTIYFFSYTSCMGWWYTFDMSS